MPCGPLDAYVHSSSIDSFRLFGQFVEVTFEIGNDAPEEKSILRGMSLVSG